ncbi:MAG: hypothetical protein D6781_01335 [Verrucomicrobia bacterium]|nr:MAG: hypothetical protein D6781_01335 [Verrucomicrobiota bacterium]
MSQETITYLTNIVIGLILACLMTHSWLRHAGSRTHFFWMLGAWVMTVADVLFAIRPVLPLWADKLVPTLLVTVGHGVLLLAAQSTAGLRLGRRVGVLVLAVHAAVLTAIFLEGNPGNLRMITNGLIWGGISVASALCLRRGPSPYWNSFFAPSTVFFAHAIFHAGRVVLAAIFDLLRLEGANDALSLVGDLEVSFFMVGLFVGLLVADLQKRNNELTAALAEVKTLSGLLPICAWCKKVRDDDGYWKQVEDFIRSRSEVEFTHSICAECASKLVPDDTLQEE